ncbi:MAG: DegT/DnrJ/EryC1/StrS family aminotransferase [Gammaproteobacteria bacterium]|nr:DegT/DnrJ/EryC1/StrS family aminotransferase [Gammaproteobacteria bacterium]
MSKHYITKPILPEFDEFSNALFEIWGTRQLTNSGPYLKRFEKALSTYLGVESVSTFCNGTIALMTALKALGVKGEVITTPFTFSATVNVLDWINATPVFCDIDPDTMCIDASKIVGKITPQTTAIMPVHVYGIPCDTNAIERIAKKHNLKVIYDGAHTFGENITDTYSCGDATILSFHATKMFHTIEGGGLITKDKLIDQKGRLLKNFGIVDEDTVKLAGINGKMNEVQSIMGLMNLNLIDEELAKRSALRAKYDEVIDDLPGVKNFSHLQKSEFYYPIKIEADQYGKTRDQLFNAFREDGIYVRKYFYPLCSEYDFFKHLPSSRKENLIVAHDVSEKILCLPFYGDMDVDIFSKVVNILKENLCK